MGLWCYIIWRKKDPARWYGQLVIDFIQAFSKLFIPANYLLNINVKYIT